MNGDFNMINFIKSFFNRKSTLEQQLQQCDYLDSLQNKAIEGMKLI